jgi:2,4-dienoyl-CoA reductase-like NADH-dependent reductase (Old Yellow Enzyme family)
MEKRDFDGVVSQFRRAAALARLAGFQGVQVHCAHGYLLAQTLSPRTNRRTDEYMFGDSYGLKLVLDIVRTIRSDSPSSFCLAVKLNSADYAQGGLGEDVALEHVRLLAKHGGVDIIEVSGGSYENVGKYSILCWPIDCFCHRPRNGGQEEVSTKEREKDGILERRSSDQRKLFLPPFLLRI